jgi:hypothetical protein
MSGAELVWEGAVEVRVVGEVVDVPLGLRERVDELWELECARRPELTDGTILSVRGVSGGIVLVQPCPYRAFIARERDATMRHELGISAIGVSGVLMLTCDGILGVVAGRRAATVTEYAGAWELVPSGGLGPSLVGIDGLVDAVGGLFDELEEEADISRGAVAHVRHLGLVRDVAQDGYDVCFALHVHDGVVGAMPEYDETVVLAPRDAIALFSHPSEHVVPTSCVILAAAQRAGLL